jgi:hypothetical protein
MAHQNAESEKADCNNSKRVISASLHYYRAGVKMATFSKTQRFKIALGGFG